MNKTREEIARDYVTRQAHNVEYSRLMDKIDKLDAKIDKLITLRIMAIRNTRNYQHIASGSGQSQLVHTHIAQQIAGGMPMSQVIAPGVSYSPEMAGGYTQKDLDMIAAPAPVMPIAPTTGCRFATS